MRRDILPGVLDAGLSSLATFVMGFYAARYLPPTILGGYALVFSAFMLMTKVPSQLLFKPAEIAAVGFPSTARLQLLPQTLRLGMLPTLLSAIAISGWLVVAPPGIPAPAMVAMTLTAVLAAIVSPAQDHVRRMLHMADGSWHAAGVSAVQLIVTLVGIWTLRRLGTGTSWVPFGALALANLLSIVAGLCVRPRSRQVAVDVQLSFRDLATSGRWLVVIGLMPLAAAFVAATVVSHLAGASTLGFTEGARVLGQPPFVLAAGLGAVLGPRSMEAVRAGRYAEARRVSRVYALVTLLCGLPYLALVGFAWDWNPVARLLPNAFAISGLVSLTILGNMLIGMDWPYRSELMGAGRTTALARLEATANAARIGIALTATATGAFAIPVGLVTLAAVRSLGYRVALRAVWEAPSRA
jgi:O-antigen/teichoic acid export membrane protein